MVSFTATTYTSWSRLLLLLSLIGNACALPTCANRTAGADRTCPSTSRCWNNTATSVLVTWSLHNECKTCTFAQQKSVIVQSTETVTFETDGTFQRNSTLEVYKVRGRTALQNCNISGSTLVGELTPPRVRNAGSDQWYSVRVNVTSLVSEGPNYFVSVHSGDVHTNAIPSNCEQGARLTVHRGNDHCGDASSLCSGFGPCVFDYDSSEFKCQCPHGYTGPACEEIDECFQNTACGNPETEGVCVDDNCDFSCSCIGGHSSSRADGKSCDVAPDDCSANPCQNRGTCVAGGLGLNCECVFGFEEQFCGSVHDCISNPCHNGGTCEDGINSYTCSCAAGFTGTDCSVNINDCSPSPCVNTGGCADGVVDATCTCSSPWTGKFCQIHENDCLAATCLNGATCIDGDSSHICSCAPGFTGVACEIDINECESYPCLNNATCIHVSGMEGYNCNCELGFTGVSCETEIDDKCIFNPCYNGGTCNVSSDSVLCENEVSCFDYECSWQRCSEGYRGLKCEVSVVEGCSGLTAGAIAAIVCGVVVSLCSLVLLACCAAGRRRRKKKYEYDL